MHATHAADESVSVDARRARYEQFSFRVPAPGYVNVANHSYGDDVAASHCYTVRFDGDDVAGCSCPHWERRQPDGGCKHMLATRAVEAVVRAATAEGRQ